MANPNNAVPFQLRNPRLSVSGNPRRDYSGLLIPGNGDPIDLLEARKQVACYFLDSNSTGFTTPRTKSRIKVIKLIETFPSLALDTYKYIYNSGRVGYVLAFHLLFWEDAVRPNDMDPILAITKSIGLKHTLCSCVQHSPVERHFSDQALLYILSKVEAGAGNISLFTAVAKAFLIKGNANGQGRSGLSWRVLQALLEKSLAYESNRQAMSILGCLHLLNYDIFTLAQVRGRYPQLCERVQLFWPGLTGRFCGEVANKFDRLIRHQKGRLIKRINCGRHNWDIAGWEGFLRSLVKCRNLRSLNLCLPTEWLASSCSGYQALKCFFQKMLPLKFMSLGCSRRKGTDMCLQHVVLGLETNHHHDGPLIKTLVLNGFGTIHCHILDRLGQFVGALVYGCIKRVHHTLVGPRIQVIRGDDAVASSNKATTGLDLWKAIARVPNHQKWDSIKSKYSRTPKVASAPYEPFLRVTKARRVDMSCLTSLRIDASGYEPSQGSDDITNALVTMLQLMSLKELEIASRSGSRFDASCSLGFDVHPVVQALKHNQDLKKLKLHGLSFVGGNLQGVPSLLWKALENNTTLQELSAFEEKAVFTIFPGRPFRHGYHYYADQATSQKIQYKCWVTKFGGCKLRDAGITRSDFVQLLFSASRERGSADARVSAIIETVCKEPRGTDTSLKQLWRIHHKLRLQCAEGQSWCHAKTGRYQADTLSILYGLLRESPGVWSSTIEGRYG